eukprot:CAMPEP_0174903276 /NCGR_PEP_ID=MMETSP0167-20121228/43052_1 /TAXON_ID=38298 /ORGANISM="Rhodella maculata, Strain CCMP736" /LENGTH=82 /DNA_ID=CAMNT_0016145565 /DNA_START=154 /DNA_END=399 /DNA_ORIENTATION=-
MAKFGDVATAQTPRLARSAVGITVNRSGVYIVRLRGQASRPSPKCPSALRRRVFYLEVIDTGRGRLCREQNFLVNWRGTPIT